MASSKVILASVFKVADKTSGRDKICRLVQYGSKFLSWVLEQEALSPELVQKLRSLESSISTARKLFRLGKSVDNFYSALDTIHLGNPILRVMITLTKLNRGLYLLIDHFIWAHRMNLIKVDSPYWNKLSNRFWLLAIFLGLLRDLYEIMNAIQVEVNRRKQLSETASSPSSSHTSTRQIVMKAISSKPAVVLDVVKNSSDFFIPLSRLDILYVPSGIVGLLGVVSSVAGLVATYNEQLKLKFS